MGTAPMNSSPYKPGIIIQADRLMHSATVMPAAARISRISCNLLRYAAASCFRNLSRGGKAADISMLGTKYQISDRRAAAEYMPAADGDCHQVRNKTSTLR